LTGEVRVLRYEPRYERDIVDICWRTGLMGESLESTGRFEDRRLFAMLFCLPWAAFEPESCFVAVARVAGGAPGAAGERAVGYILGTADTVAQKRDFDSRMAPRIVARLVLYDWWRHPESFRQVLRFARFDAAQRGIEAARGPRSELGGPEYPAHLHMNLLPEWQRRGIGGRLMDAFIDRMRARGVPGVFLETTDRNLKALPFYRARGFEVARETPGELWAGIPAMALAMTLRLDSQ
jgi:ribosomal protein S18 acetylase RimI-like enzyme